MAITNAQQYQQLVNKPANGKRPGYKGRTDANTMSGSGYGASTNFGGEQNTGENNYTDRIMDVAERKRRADLSTLANIGADDKRQEQLERFRKLNSPQRKVTNFLSKISPFANVSSMFGYNPGPFNNRDYMIDKMSDKQLQNFANLDEDEKETVYDSFMEDQRNRFTSDESEGGDTPIIPQGIMAQAPSDIDQELEEDDEIINYRLMSNGGSTNDISLQEAKDMAPKGEFLAYINKKEANMLKKAGGSGIMTNAGIPSFVEYGGISGFEGAKSTGSVQGDVDRGPGGDGPKGPPTNVGGGVTNLKSKKDIPTLNTDFTKFDVKDLINLGLVDPESENTQLAMITDTQKGIIDKQGNIGKLTGAFNPDATFEAAKGAFDKETNTYGFDDKGEKNIFSADRPAEPMTRQEFDAYVEEKGYATGGRAGLAEGGMPYEGGIMDLESARQMYGLGKLVKKVTRSVKKIAKSPVGKAAIGAALFNFGGGFKADGFFNTKILPSLYKDGAMTGLGKTLLYAGVPALAAGLMTPKQEDEEEEFYRGEPLGIANIRANPGAFQAPRFMAEGGSTEEKEPVAKKVMPLLDMDGKEKDYRETGGFVDMGRMEKADDVPARLSKNEFVFTADAVRNAGDGSVDKGAEVMYNMMKNLESGGDVSEESQGLEGARDMFQTSQRLEEVL